MKIKIIFFLGIIFVILGIIWYSYPAKYYNIEKIKGDVNSTIHTGYLEKSFITTKYSTGGTVIIKK